MTRTGAPRRILASCLCATGLLVAALPSVASADNTYSSHDSVQAGPGGAVIKNGQNLVKAGDGCALVVGGGHTVSAGDCSHGSADQPSSTTPAVNHSSTQPTGTTSANPSPDPTTSASTEEGTTSSGNVSTTSLTGGTTTGPGKTEDQLCPSAPPKDALKATVGRAVDGDTLQLDRKIEGTDRVRLIGVDTSELHGQNGKSEPYAEAAKTFTSDQLKGKDVLLAPGKDKTDDYGRLLAYVWTTPGDGLMGAVKGMLGGGPALFNRTLVDKGYARVMPVPPNDRYAACFEATQKAARSSGEGRWTTDATTFDEPMGGSTADGATLSTPPRPGETTGGATLPATTETTLATTTATTAPAKTTGPTASSSISASPITSATTSGKPEVTTQETTVQPATTTPGTTAGSTSTDQASTPLPPSVDTTPAQPTLPDTWPPPSASPRATAVTPTATPTVSPETSSAPSTIPYESLPQSTTPSGYTHHVLPDTGGRSPLYLLIGAALVGAGLLVWRGRPQDGPGS